MKLRKKVFLLLILVWRIPEKQRRIGIFLGYIKKEKQHFENKHAEKMDNKGINEMTKI